MIIRSKFSGYSADGSRRLYKGGGSVKYDNLERLYEMQAAQGQQMMDFASRNVYPAFESMIEDSRSAGSIANQEVAAERAGADVSAAMGDAKKQLGADLASMGVNPADARYAGTMARMQLEGQAQKAAAQTGARDKTKALGYARTQDAVSLGMGIPSNAVSALNSAGGMASNIAGMQQQSAANQSAAMGNIAALGTRMMGFKCGGLVGKPMRKYAAGGVIGAIGGIKPPQPPASTPRQSGSPLTSAVAGGGAPGAGKMIEGAGNLIGKIAPEAGNAVQSFGTGLRLGADAQPAIEAFQAASTGTQAAGAAATGAEAAGAATAGAEAAGAAAAGAEAAGAAAAGAEVAGAAAAGAEAAGTAATAMGAGSAIGGALAAAMPWVGGALLIGSALDLFADGGEVKSRDTKLVDAVDARAGGRVSGPGGPKDDLVPAMLSAEEFVMPVGTVKLYGLKALEQMRARGLQHEKQLGIK